MDHKSRDERRYWLDEPRNVTKVVYGLIAACAISMLADLFYVKHVHFPWEGIFNFHGWYGFVCCFLLVLAAKELRKAVKRDEDYYD